MPQHLSGTMDGKSNLKHASELTTFRDEIPSSNPDVLFSAATVVGRFSLCCLIGAVVCFLFVDQYAAEVFSTKVFPGEVSHLIDSGEHFGTPYGQLLILGTLFVSLRFRFPQAVRIFVGATLAGLTGNLIKLMVARARPRYFHDVLQGDSIFDSLIGWFPLGMNKTITQGFPSSHTACAFAFAVLLSWAFPAGRPAFFLLAFMCCVHRIYTLAHFPSDVLIGAIIGFSIGHAFTTWGPIVNFYSRFESWWMDWLESKKPGTIA
jgi:membrane-associated phospholipid phosphatase